MGGYLVCILRKNRARVRGPGK